MLISTHFKHEQARWFDLDPVCSSTSPLITRKMSSDLSAGMLQVALTLGAAAHGTTADE
jgi:hypothetical protein